MPKVQDYKKNKNASTSKRRPGRDPEHVTPEPEVPQEDATESVIESVVESNSESTINASSESASQSAQFDPYDSSNYEEPVQEEAAPEKTHLEFYGSELIRLKAPKVMEVADEVVDQWKKDGDFQGLPVGHPLAQFAVAKGLKTAKEVEKKLEEKGVFAMAKMGIMYAEHELKKRGIIKK